MNDLEPRILRALLDLEEAIRTMPTAHPKPDLVAHFAGIDALAAQLPGHTPPELRHYLHKKSYEKARLFLEAKFAEIKKGGCRGD